MNPKILCIIPVYNAQSTLKGAIESIINQNYHNWELIIVDDASTDKSFSIAQKYAKNHSNITVLKNHTNQGCYYSRNRALHYMKDKEWDVFTIHDADDTSTHDRFTLYLNTLILNSTTSVLIGIFNGKRWKWNSETPKIQYIAAGEATGVNWYKRDIFTTFGYFMDTRFGGDAEYVERIQEYLFRICPSNISPTEFQSQVIKKLDNKYSYTYTTGFHLGGNLTQNYKKPERVQFKNYYQNLHRNEWSSPKDFYINFEPQPEDIILQ